jgi:hypothetical protein
MEQLPAKMLLTPVHNNSMVIVAIKQIPRLQMTKLPLLDQEVVSEEGLRLQ